MIANKLSNLVSKREHVIANLENALAIEDLTGNAPTRNTGLVGGIPGVGNAVGAIPVLGGAMTGERVNAIEREFFGCCFCTRINMHLIGYSFYHGGGFSLLA